MLGVVLYLVCSSSFKLSLARRKNPNRASSYRIFDQYTSKLSRPLKYRKRSQAKGT
jgi:hypothetical protein